MHALAAVRRQALRRRLVRCSATAAVGKPVFVTTPIYYVNAQPHLGHVYTSTLADWVARSLAFFEPHRGGAVLCTGTDEHGLKIQQAAAAAGKSTADFVDGISRSFRDVHDVFGIRYHHFVRTTSPVHAEVVRWLWQRLAARGDIYLDEHAGWYCTSDEAFVPEKAVVTRAQFLEARGLPPDAATAAAAAATASGGGGGGAPAKAPLDPTTRVSSESGHPVEWVTERNYRFRLTRYLAPLLEWLAANPQAVQPACRYNEVVAFLQGGTQDLSISRPRERVSWALPVPGDESQSVYVWLDALANYLTAAMGYCKTTTTTAGGGGAAAAVPSSAELEAAQARATLAAIPPPPPADADVSVPPAPLPDDSALAAAFPAWPADVQVIGKDILRFHAVYWPAFLMSAGLALPKAILAHGHWTVDRQKMSKSIGNVVVPTALIKPAGPHSVDAVRYFLLSDGGIDSDGDYSDARVEHRCVNDCADKMGNLAARVLTSAFLPGGRLPEVSRPRPADAEGVVATGDALASAEEEVEQLVAAMTPDEKALAAALGTLRDTVHGRVSALDPRGALEAVMEVAAHGNRVFAAAEPWKLASAMKAVSSAAAAGTPVSNVDVTHTSLRLRAVLYAILETLRICGILLQPTMPDATALLLARLGVAPCPAVADAAGGASTAAAAAASPLVPAAHAVFGHVAPSAYALDFGACKTLVLFPKPPPCSTTACSTPPPAPSKAQGGGVSKKGTGKAAGAAAAAAAVAAAGGAPASSTSLH